MLKILLIFGEDCIFLFLLVFSDYVYIPFGGSRRGRVRTYFNLFITMVLSGIWHGANLTFVVWGIIHGIGSAILKGMNDLSKSRNSDITIPTVIKILMNFVFVSFAWVFLGLRA
ncbi:MBOAT family O-acyltransferase [Butyrivibrio sp. AE2032]|uniref:MBOAT family O-acyltransferase n=1 Tax=Butyrivibrio sp. AE2032 TaxID=1458463 RepID=UPI0006919D19